MPKTRSGVTVELIGAATLKRNFKLYETRIKAAAKRVINISALNIRNDAVKNVPVDEGRLKTTLRPTFYQNGMTAEIGTNAGYGVHVEFGTGPRGRATNTYPLPPGYTHGSGGKMPPIDVIREWAVRHSIPPKFAYVIARKIGKHGLAARPFLTPAYLAERPKFNRRLARVIKNTNAGGKK
jgi:hypothetical protein